MTILVIHVPGEGREELVQDPTRRGHWICIPF